MKLEKAVTYLQEQSSLWLSLYLTLQRIHFDPNSIISELGDASVYSALAHVQAFDLKTYSCFIDEVGNVIIEVCNSDDIYETVCETQILLIQKQFESITENMLDN